jgi:hypothetical protein
MKRTHALITTATGVGAVLLASRVPRFSNALVFGGLALAGWGAWNLVSGPSADDADFDPGSDSLGEEAADFVFGKGADAPHGALQPLAVRRIDLADVETLQTVHGFRQVAPARGGTVQTGAFSVTYPLRFEITNQGDRDTFGELVLELDEDYVFSDERRVLRRFLARVPALSVSTFETVLALSRFMVARPSVTGTASYLDARQTLDYTVET